MYQDPLSEVDFGHVQYQSWTDCEADCLSFHGDTDFDHLYTLDLESGLYYILG
jgi:hypothetical protein